MSDGETDARRLPPLRLDTAPEQPEPDGPGDGRPWRGWVGLGLALITGVVAGVLGANARHDALEQARIELVGGRVELEPVEAAPTTAASIWDVDFLVFNSSAQRVDLTRMDITGWTGAEDAGPMEPVSLRPRVWTVVRTQLVPDCDDEPAGGRADRLVAEAVVRGDGPEQTLPLEFESGRQRLDAVWTSRCTTDDIPSTTVSIVSAEVEPREQGDTTLRSRLGLWVPPPPNPDTRVSVVRVWPLMPGVDVAVTGTPAEFSAEGHAEIDVTWEIGSCGDLGGVDQPSLTLHVAAGDGQAPSALAQGVPVPAPVLLEIGRLAAEVC